MPLPEHIEPAAATAAAEPDERPTHLQAVPDVPAETPGETTTEIPVVVDAPADEPAADADLDDVGEHDDADGESEPSRYRQVVAGVRFDMPLFTERPYSASEVYRRAQQGAQIAESGPLRIGAQVYGALAMVGVYGLNACQWVISTPTRAVVAALLTAALLAVPVLQPIAHIATWIPAQIHTITE